MNMNKALQNLYHAVSGSTTTKVNISKLLVDIHQAITGKESSNKNNWSRIINSMADNWPGGGGGVTVEELNVTDNGTYTAPTGKAYSPVKVNVSGGGSSDFSTAQVTVELVGEPRFATLDIYLIDLLTGDANGLVEIEEDDIRYITTESQVIELEKPSHTEAEKIIYLYKNNPVYVAWREAQSTSDYTITGSGEAVALDLDGTLMYAVKVTGDCTITIS